jgi:hypothetical protein
MTAPAEADAPQAQNPHHDRRWLILAVLGLAQLMVVLDATIVNIAPPTAQRALSFSNADRQWIVEPPPASRTRGYAACSC